MCLISFTYDIFEVHSYCSFHKLHKLHLFIAELIFHLGYILEFVYLVICQWTFSLAIVNSVAVNVNVQVFEDKLKIGIFNSLQDIPQSKIARSHGNSMSHFLRHCQTISVVAKSFYIPTNNAQFPRGHEVVSCCGFDLHFPSFHVPIDSLYTSFGEVSSSALPIYEQFVFLCWVIRVT